MIDPKLLNSKFQSISMKAVINQSIEQKYTTSMKSTAQISKAKLDFIAWRN